MRGHSGVWAGPSASTVGPPSPSGRGVTSTGGGVGGEQGTDGRVAEDRRWAEGGRRADGGVHSFSNSHSFEEFTVEIGTLP